MDKTEVDDLVEALEARRRCYVDQAELADTERERAHQYGAEEGLAYALRLINRRLR